MATPYLNEVRTGGETKRRLREITYDVANQFGVRGAVDPRPVPHMTLFGPYDTNRGWVVKRTVKDVLSEFDKVPYRIDGFGRFEQNKVIYANVVPSPELRELRRELSRRLRPITNNYPPFDSSYFYDFHITIAYRDVGEKFRDIWEYVNSNFDPQFDEYATRVTSLRRRDMMWEYDVVSGEELRPNEATSAASWERTSARLDELSASDDHDELSTKPPYFTRLVKPMAAKARGRW